MNTQIEILFRNSLDYISIGKLSEAKHLLQKILVLDYAHLGTLNCLAMIASIDKDLDQALAYINRAILNDPSDSRAYINRGNILQTMHSFGPALEDCKHAISLSPSSPEAHNNLGNTLQSLNRHREAVESYHQALSLRNHYPQALNNLGNAFKALKKFDDAIENYLRAIALNPQYGSAYWNLSLTQLLLGDYTNGLQNYEYRWLKENAETYLHQEIPKLQTLETLNGSHVLLWAEQGFGDTIQFVRYIPLLMDMGARITLQVQSPLKSLLENNLDCNFIDFDHEVPTADYQLPLGSLPLIFRTQLDTIPSNTPYLKVHPNKMHEWKLKLNPKKNKLNIGIACSGNIKFDLAHGNTRPVPLALFAPLSDTANLFLIQKEIRPDDLSFLQASRSITYLGDQIETFEDTAAIAANLDAIVTIDTSLAHLAGALGMPTFVLLPWVPDWRWGINGDHSPWYPNTHLLRQEEPGKWDEVIASMRANIVQLTRRT
ncbi:tetratricopeptide repeat protein [Polynucleobacter paneuropaeus]|nr:tetratricopeptide repeat protein [Polynucleobacter paneuropaeus]QWD09301.1 tetratricopeptide repeat protein [Polynucleobacter paneuropaeus]QWD46068.1 tetratricopeptide repeat protein [Polynucleobacter paneuropaeus]